MVMMKGIRLHEFGGPDVLKYEDIPRPEPKAGDVLVRVQAAGVIATDWQFRSGLMPGFLGITLPATPGWDVSGTVEALGPGVDRLRVGDEVYAMLPGQGGYAEYAVAHADTVAFRPASLDAIEAGAVPLAATTAYKCLYTTAQVSDGQTVLIHGAAGGVGSFAVQLAKARGASVIAVASGKNLAFVRSLGADQVIDHGAVRFEDFAQDVDVVLDVIGGDNIGRSLHALRKGGLLVTIAGQPPGPESLAPQSLRAAFVSAEPDGEALLAITRLIEDGRVKPHIHRVLPLAEAAEAHRTLEAGQVQGKLVLQSP